MEIIKDIQNAFLSELIIFIFIIINIIMSLFIKKNLYKFAKILNITAIMLAGFSMLFVRIEPQYNAFNNIFISNAYTASFKIMILISALLIIFSSNNLLKTKRHKSFEFFALFLSGILGAFSLISSNDFISAFISMELLGISCYFLTGSRNNLKSKEASFKYLITGASSSAFLLLGFSYLYGITGNINFSDINDILYITGVNLFFVLSCLLIICALMFKLGCVPFNNWIIDIYGGSSYPVCAYLSLIPKIAVLCFISRLFVLIFSFSPILRVITAFIALYSIIYAALGAVNQTNIKKIYGYSSIIHSGFILLAVSILNVYSVSAALFYIFAYIFMNIGIWTASTIYTERFQTDEISDYKGLFYKRPYYTSALSLCLISLAGLPVTGGFTAKLYLFSALSRADFIYLIILFLVLIAAVVCIFVYFKIIKILFETPDSAITIMRQNFFPEFILYLCAVITIILGICPNKVIELAQIIAYNI